MSEPTAVGILDLLTKHDLVEDKWDNPAMLSVITTGGIAVVVLSLDEDVEVFDALTMIAQSPQYIANVIEGETVIGLALVVEAWGLSENLRKGSELVSEAKAIQAMGLRLSDHPDAVELKLYLGIDATGIYARKIERGDDKVIDQKSTPEAMAGRIPAVLTSLFEAVRNYKS